MSLLPSNTSKFLLCMINFCTTWNLSLCNEWGYWDPAAFLSDSCPFPLLGAWGRLSGCCGCVVSWSGCWLCWNEMHFVKTGAVCLQFILFALSCFSVQFSHSVISDSCDPMDCSTPGLPVYHQLPEFTQTHVHWVSDAIQPFYPLSSPSPPTFNLSQHQGLFKWVSSSQWVAKILEFQFQHLSFRSVFRTDFL